MGLDFSSNRGLAEEVFKGYDKNLKERINEIEDELKNENDPEKRDKLIAKKSTLMNAALVKPFGDLLFKHLEINGKMNKISGAYELYAQQNKKGGFYGGDDISSTDLIKNYGTTANALVKEELVDKIAEAVSKLLGQEVSGKNRREKVESLLKIIPNIENKKISSEPKQVETCVKIGTELNKQLGINFIDTTLPAPLICQQISEILYSLTAGVSIEYLAVKDNIKTVIRNIELLNVELKRAYESISAKLSALLKAADADISTQSELKSSLGSLDAVMNESLRQQELLKNFINLGVRNDEIDLETAIRNAGSVREYIAKIDKDVVGTKTFSDTIMKIISNMIYTTRGINLVNDLISKFGVTVGNLSELDLKKAEEALRAAAMKSGVSDKQVYEINSAIDFIKKLAASRNIIGSGRKGGVEKFYYAPLPSNTPASFSVKEKEYESRYSRDLKMKLARRDIIFNTFRNDIYAKYEGFIKSFETFVNKASGDTSNIEQLEDLKMSLKSLQMTMTKKYSFLSLMGYFNDAKSLEIKEQFLSSISRTLAEIDRTQASANPQYREYYEDLKRSLNEIKNLISSFTDKIREMFGSAEDSDTLSEDDLKKEGGADDLRVDTIQLLKIDRDFNIILQQMDYNIKMSDASRLMKQEAAELNNYVEQYEQLRAEAIGMRLTYIDDYINKKEEELNNAGEYYYCNEQPGDSADVINAKKSRKATVVKFLELQRSTFKEFLKAVESVDQILLKVTNDILVDHDKLQNIRRELDGLEIIEKLSTENAGESIRKMFDWFPPSFYDFDNLSISSMEKYRDVFFDKKSEHYFDKILDIIDNTIVSNYSIVSSDNINARLVKMGPGNPFIVRELDKGFTPIKNAESAVFGISALESIFLIFRKLGGAVSKEIGKGSYMSFKKIYLAFLNYLYVSAFGMGLPGNLSSITLNINDKNNVAVRDLNNAAFVKTNLSDSLKNIKKLQDEIDEIWKKFKNVEMEIGGVLVKIKNGTDSIAKITTDIANLTKDAADDHSKILVLDASINYVKSLLQTIDPLTKQLDADAKARDLRIQKIETDITNLAAHNLTSAEKQKITDDIAAALKNAFGTDAAQIKTDLLALQKALDENDQNSKIAIVKKDIADLIHKNEDEHGMLKKDITEIRKAALKAIIETFRNFNVQEYSFIYETDDDDATTVISPQEADSYHANITELNKMFDGTNQIVTAKIIQCIDNMHKIISKIQDYQNSTAAAEFEDYDEDDIEGAYQRKKVNKKGGAQHKSFNIDIDNTNPADIKVKINNTMFGLTDQPIKRDDPNIDRIKFLQKFGIYIRGVLAGVNEGGPFGDSSNNSLDNPTSLDNLFNSSITAICGKIFTIVGLFDMREHPGNIPVIGTIRTMLGGTDLSPPKIDPANAETYIRLLLLLQLFRDLFSFDKTDDPANPYIPDVNNPFAEKITLVPDFTGKYAELISLYFKEMYNVNLKNMSDFQLKKLIEAINRIIAASPGKSTKEICEEFKHEINRRYGLVLLKDRNDFVKQHYRYNYPDYVYENSKGYETTPSIILNSEDVEYNLPSITPSSKYEKGLTQLPVELEITKERKRQLSGDYYNLFRKFRCRIDDYFRYKVSSPNVSENQRYKLGDISIKDLIFSTKKMISAEPSADGKFSIISRFLRNSEISNRSEQMKYIMFHELIIAPLNILAAIFAYLYKFRNSVLMFKFMMNTEMTKFEDVLDAAYFNGKYTNNVKKYFSERERGQLLSVNNSDVIGKGYFELLTPGNKINMYGVCMLLLDLLNLGGDLGKMVEVKIDDSINFNFSVLKNHCETLLSNVKSAVDIFRTILPDDFVKDYIDKSSRGSLYWIQEQLFEKLFIGRPPIENPGNDEKHTHGYFSLDDCNSVLNSLWRICRKSDNVRDLRQAISVYLCFYENNGSMVIPPERDETNIMAIYFPDMSNPAHNYSYIDKLCYNYNGEYYRANPKLLARFNYFYTFDKYWSNSHGLIICFNQLIAKLISKFYDPSVQKIYAKVFNNFVSGVFNNSIFNINVEHSGNNVFIDTITIPISYRSLETRKTTRDETVHADIMGKPFFTPSNARDSESLLRNISTRDPADDFYPYANLHNSNFSKKASYIESAPQDYGTIMFKEIDTIFINDDPNNYLDGLKDYMKKTNKNVLFASLANILNNIYSSKNKLGDYFYITNNISDLPLHVRESFRNDIPGFITLATELKMRAELFLNIYGFVDDKFNHRDQLKKIINGCEELIKGLEEIQREVSQESKYFDIHAGFIDEYKAKYGKLPLMPLSNITAILKNTVSDKAKTPQYDKTYGVSDCDIFLTSPFKKIFTPPFKFQYGVKNILHDFKNIKLENLVGYYGLIEQFNILTKNNHTIDKKLADSIAISSISLLRYINEIRFNRSLLTQFTTRYVLLDQDNTKAYEGVMNSDDIRKYKITEVAGSVTTTQFYIRYIKNQGYVNSDDIELYYPLLMEEYTKVVFPAEGKKGEITKIINMAENVYQESEYKRLSEYISDDGLPDMGDMEIANILDLGIVPINIAALSRSIALVFLYNYEYTGDSMIVDTLYENVPRVGELLKQICNKDYMNDNNSPKELFVKLLLNPYLPIYDDKNYAYLNAIFRGAHNIQLSRPKFTFDEIFNSLLFCSAYPSSTSTANNLDRSNPGRKADFVGPASSFGTKEAFDGLNYIVNKNNEDDLDYGGEIYSVWPGKGAANKADKEKQVTIISYLKFLGKLRYNTIFVRNIIHIIDMLRIINLRIRNELNFNFGIVSNSINAVQETNTEYNRNQIKKRTQKYSNNKKFV